MIKKLILLLLIFVVFILDGYLVIHTYLNRDTNCYGGVELLHHDTAIFDRGLETGRGQTILQDFYQYKRAWQAKEPLSSCAEVGTPQQECYHFKPITEKEYRKIIKQQLKWKNLIDNPKLYIGLDRQIEIKELK